MACKDSAPDWIVIHSATASLCRLSAGRSGERAEGRGLRPIGSRVVMPAGQATSLTHCATGHQSRGRPGAGVTTPPVRGHGSSVVRQAGKQASKQASRQASKQASKQGFNTEDGRRATKGHGEGIDAFRAVPEQTPARSAKIPAAPWPSVALRPSSVLNPCLLAMRRAPGPAVGGTGVAGLEVCLASVGNLV